MRRRWLAPLLICVGLLAVAAPALAHIERASYWPDPGVDNASGQPTGGAVPVPRDLPSALDKSAPGDTRVVCEGTVPKSPKTKVKRAKKNLNGRALKRKLKKIHKGYNKKVNANPSIQALNGSIKDALVNGYKLASLAAAADPITNQNAKDLRKVNKKLLPLCSYNSIQAAVTIRTTTTGS